MKMVIVLYHQIVICKTTNFGTDPLCDGDWSTASCWDNGSPISGDDLIFDSCIAADSVIVPRYLPNFRSVSLNSPSDCLFSLQFAPGASLRLSHLSLYSGQISGSGFIQCSETALFFSDRPKTLHSQIMSAGLMTFEDGPMTLKLRHQGVLSNTGVANVLTPLTITYDEGHLLSDDVQPSITNAKILDLKADYLRIDVPFVNMDELRVSSGTAEINNPVELMGNYFINGTLVLNADSVFERESIIDGMGIIDVSAGVTIQLNGLFRFSGNVLTRTSSRVFFTDSSVVSNYRSTLAEPDSLVEFLSGCKLQLLNFGLNIKNGTYLVYQGSSWEPFGGFEVVLDLSGDASFTFDESIGNVVLTHVSVVENARLHFGSGRTVSIDHLTLGNGQLCDLQPHISGKDELRIGFKFFWYNGLLDNPLTLLNNLNNENPPAEIHVLPESILYEDPYNHYGQLLYQVCAAVLGPDVQLRVQGKAFFNGTLNIHSNIIVDGNSWFAAPDAIHFLKDGVSVDLSDTSESYVTLDSSLSVRPCPNSQIKASISFRGNLTLTNSVFDISRFVDSFYGSNSNYMLEFGSTFLIQSPSPQINGIFDTSDGSIVTTADNTILFVPGSIFQGKGGLIPGTSGNITFSGIYRGNSTLSKPQGSMIFRDAFISTLEAIEGVSGHFNFINCTFESSTQLVLNSIVFSSVESVFSLLKPSFHINNFLIESSSVWFNSTGSTLSISEASVFGNLTISNIPNMIQINRLIGKDSSLITIPNHKGQLTLPFVHLSDDSALHISEAVQGVTFPHLFLNNSASIHLQFCSSLHFNMLQMHAHSKLISSSIDSFSFDDIEMFNNAVIQQDITTSFSGQNISLFNLSKLELSNVNSVVVINIFNHALLSLNFVETVSVTTYLQEVCHSALEFNTGNTFSSTSFSVTSGSVLFKNIDYNVFESLNVDSIDTCSTFFIHDSFKSLSVSSSFSLSDRCQWVITKGTESLTLPAVDITGQLSILNLAFPLSLPSVLLSKTAVLHLNSGQPATVQGFFNMYDQATRSGTDLFVVKGNSIFEGGVFVDSGVTRFDAELHLMTDNVKLLTNFTTISVNSLTTITPDVEYLEFEHGASLSLTSSADVDVLGSTVFSQLPTSNPSSIVSQSGSKIEFKGMSSLEVFWSGSISATVQNNGITLLGASDFQTAIFDITNSFLLFDGHCYSESTYLDCDDPVEFVFAASSVLKSSPSVLKVSESARLLYSGDYDLEPAFINSNGKAHFINSDNFDVVSISNINGTLIVENSANSQGQNQWSFLSVFDGHVHLDDLSNLIVDDVILSGGETLFERSSSTLHQLLLPHVTLTGDSYVSFIDSSAVIEVLHLLNGTVSSQITPLKISQDIFVDNGVFSTTQTSILIGDSAELSFINEGTKKLLSNSRLELLGSLVLDSSGPFIGFSGAEFIVDDQAIISFSQPSVWGVNDSFNRPLFEMLCETSMLLVQYDFDISWQISLRSDVFVTDKSAFRIAGGGTFDSIISLCANCSIEMANGVFNFMSQSVIQGIEGNVDARHLITDNSTVLFAGNFLLHPDIILGSGHLHFMKGSVFEVTSVIVPEGGALTFSQCPVSGPFVLFHLIIEGDVVFSHLPCNITIHVLSINGGSLVFEDLSGNLDILGMDLQGGSLVFNELVRPLFMDFLTVNGSTVMFNSSFDVTIDNLTINGASIISGEDHIHVSKTFLFYGGTLDNINITVSKHTVSEIATQFPKFLWNSNLIIHGQSSVFDCFITFGFNAYIHFTVNSNVQFFDYVQFSHFNDTLISDLSSLLDLSGPVNFIFANASFDVFVSWVGNSIAQRSSISLSNGCNFSSSLVFDGHSQFSLLDKGIFYFDNNAKLIGAETIFVVSSSSYSLITLYPVVYFHGLYELSSHVQIDFGRFYMEPSADFTVTSLTVSHPGFASLSQNKGDLWTLYDLEVSGKLHILDLERDIVFGNVSIHGPNSYVLFNNISSIASFNETIFLSQGTMEVVKFSKVFLPGLEISNGAHFISELNTLFVIEVLTSSDSTLYLKNNVHPLSLSPPSMYSHNPDSISIRECKLLSNSLLNTTTNVDLLITNLTLTDSKICGIDHVVVGSFEWFSGVVDLFLTTDYAYLISTNDKEILANTKVSVCVFGHWLDGTLIGQTLSSFIVEDSAVFHIFAKLLHFPGSFDVLTFHHGPAFVVRGSVIKYSTDIFVSEFEFHIGSTGHLLLEEGEIYLKAGGSSFGLLHSFQNTMLRLGANRNLLHILLAMRNSSFNRIPILLSRGIFLWRDIHRSISLDGLKKIKIIIIMVLFILELHLNSFPNIGFARDFVQLTLVVRDFNWCSNLFRDFHFDINVKQLDINSGVSSFSSDVTPYIESVHLSSGIIEGTDTVVVLESFIWNNGRLGSLDHLGHTLTLELLGSSKLTSDLNKNVLFRSVINNRGSFYIVDHFLFWFYRQTVLNNFGYFQHGGQCGNTVCNSLSNFVYQTLDHASSATYNNHGSFVKLEGTLILTNQLLFNQSITGYFESQNSRFVQQVVASIRGEVQLNAGTYFDVGSTTLNAWENSVWNGLGGTLRAISWGSRIFFYGRYNLTLDLVHNMGEFVFKPSADIELDTITLNDGTLVFEEGKERDAEFDLTNVRVVDGFLRISNVSQFFIIDNIYQSFGQVLIDNISNYFTIDSFKVTAGDFAIDSVAQNMTFVKKMELDGGNVYLQNLLQWLIFQDGLLVRNPHRFRIEDVGLSLWSLGDVDISGGFTVLNIGLDFVIDQDLFFRQNCTTVVNTIDNSLVVSGTITQLQAFSSQTTLFQNVKNSFVLHKDLDMRSGSLTYRDITSKVSVSQRIVQTGGSLLFDVVGDTFAVTEGMRLTGGSATFRCLSENLSTQFIEVLNPADAKFLSINTLSVVEKIEVSGTLSIDDYTHGNVPLFLVNNPSKTEIKKGITFNVTDNLRGTGGFANFRDLVVFETASFEPHGANFLFQDLHTNYLVPSFDIRSGSTVDLHRFHYSPPQLHDIGIYSGTLTLRTDQVVNTDYLVLDHSNARRNGKDLTIVRDGVDFIAGTFGTLGTTNVLNFLNLSFSARKTINEAEVISSDYAVIQVDNGEVVGINAGILRLQTVSQVFGDFHFLTTETSGIRLPQFINEDFMMFASASQRRLMDWRIELPPNTVNNVNDFELALGRGGGLIKTNITLCSDCLLAFDSNMPFTSRTKHRFTDISAISCPTCRIEFRSHQSWVDFSGIFDLLSDHVQTFGRLDFQSPARVPITHLELSNSRVFFLQPNHVLPCSWSRSFRNGINQTNAMWTTSSGSICL
ncbi:hypothetical protein GEMRC1_010569 [Eukaryota sp. GEM-RC1]